MNDRLPEGNPDKRDRASDEQTDVSETSPTKRESFAKRPPPEFLQSDITCNGCGYLLRGLNRGGICPECGLKLSSTLDGLPQSPRHGPLVIFLAIGIALTPVIMLANIDLRTVNSVCWAFRLVIPCELLVFAVGSLTRGGYPRHPGIGIDEGLRFALVFSAVYLIILSYWSCFGFPPWWI